MANQYFDSSGAVITIPGAYPKVTVQQSASGLSATGVITLIGEADAGPDYSLESDITLNFFGPNQLADVVAKYRSGQLINAFVAAAQAANDPQIVGAPQRIYIVKTNPSTKASLALTLQGAGGTYATLYDKSYGKLGNLSNVSVALSTAEAKPTTGSFTWIPNVGAVAGTLRINGGAELSLSLGANQSPTQFQTAVAALTGITCTGGASKATIQNSVGSLTVGSVVGNTAVITYSSGTFTNTPAVGDTVVIPATSAIGSAAGVSASGANVGAYVVTGATSTTISVTKLSDAGKSGAVAGTITAPVAAGPFAVSATAANDLIDYNSITAITITSSTVIDGVGKTLEINETTAADNLSRYLFALSTSAVTWVSKTGAVVQPLTSSAESAVTLSAARAYDSVSESFTAGGQVALLLGYTGTSATVTIGATTLTTSVTGGSGSNLNITLANFSTIADLATYINAQPGYTCAAATAALGQQSPFVLDEVAAASCATTWGAKTCRIKNDGYKFYTAVSGSSLVQVNNPAAAPSKGLPAATSSVQFLAGGARGGTSNTIVTSALTACESLSTNFLVPCFSRDASLDITDGLTDSSSSYTIDSINAAVLTHCLALTTIKRRRNRQGFCSKRDTFANVLTAAANLASPRVSLAFQDVKVTLPSGVTQCQPYVSAALAAGMQAAGFYKPIFNKGINCSGFIQAAGDFNPANDTQVETALLGGLLVGKQRTQGGFAWVSDQTTYIKDNNFVFNSLQAVYVMDTIALSCSQRMESAFVGQALSDISAQLMVAAVESIMADFLRLKLIGQSDDAPRGYKDLVVRISGPVALVSLTVYEATGLYFIPISFSISQVTQTASST